MRESGVMYLGSVVNIRQGVNVPYIPAIVLEVCSGLMMSFYALSLYQTSTIYNTPIISIVSSKS